MSATLFTAGTVWTGAGSESDALLVVDGTVRALGGRAREAAAGIGCEQVDLEGGFLMPSFGDGHSHPLYGGLEAVG
ncbi:MAG: amidohydrolase, partial [Mycobacterium sp.]|nr:amidohydrolase [Mycobacterium sp.]